MSTSNIEITPNSPSTPSTPVNESQMGRRFQQIGDTIVFEFIRNRKKIISLFFVEAIIFILFLIPTLRRESQGGDLPESPAEYIQGFLAMIDLTIMIVAVSIGSGVVARDYQEKTGHLLFPKITKERLLTGRIIASFLIGTLCLLFYYGLAAIITSVKYDTFPIRLFFISFAWAIFYSYAILSFVIFWSSFVKSTTLAIIASLLFLWMVFGMIEGLLGFFTEMEPYFTLTYQGNIITSSLNMPVERYTIQTFGIQDGEALTIRQWITPTPEHAFYGILIYSAVLTFLAFMMFKRRQFKG